MKHTDFTKKTRACREARAITGHRDLRCGECPWKDKECIIGNARLKKEIYVGYVTNLTEAFGYTEKLIIGTIFKLKEGE